ncbi:MAG: HepT-like ribonuclease domain-containing protein [Thermodesulfovibrionales bacterium]
MHEVLFRKLERLKEEVLYLETNRTIFLKNINISVETKKITERSVYLCAEIVLDIADLVITLRGLPKPSTYSDSIYKLGDHKIIPIGFSRKFVYIAGLRNFLAHDYLIDTINELIKFLKVGVTDIKKFINFIEKL